MSELKNKRCKVDKTDVYLDFRGAINILGKRGSVVKNVEISKNVGFSGTSLSKWNRCAPEVVSMIYHFLKDNDLRFEQFVKEVE